MFASTKAFTRADLREAFDAFAEAHGVELAMLALQRSTGTREVSAVPDSRILNGMVELVGGFSLVGRRSANMPLTATLHARLDAIREAGFRRMANAP